MNPITEVELENWTKVGCKPIVSKYYRSPKTNSLHIRVKAVSPYRKNKWKSFKKKKKKKKSSYMSNDNLIIKVKNKLYTYPPKAGVILFNLDKSKILVIKNAYNPALSKWGLPKGHVEKEETRIECAKRELLEETGIELIITPGDPFIKINNSIYYIYSTNENIHNLQPIDTDEIMECKFETIESIKTLKINRELNVAITNKLKLAKKLAKQI